MLLLVIEACGAMLLNDVLATCLTLAQSARKHKAAGHLDGLGDYTRLFLYAGAGSQLIHGHGWKGYVGMIPVALTGDIATRLSTKHGDRLMQRFGQEWTQASTNRGTLFSVAAKVLSLGRSVLSRVGVHRKRTPTGTTSQS